MEEGEIVDSEEDASDVFRFAKPVPPSLLMPRQRWAQGLRHHPADVRNHLNFSQHRDTSHLYPHHYSDQRLHSLDQFSEFSHRPEPNNRYSHSDYVESRRPYGDSFSARTEVETHYPSYSDPHFYSDPYRSEAKTHYSSHFDHYLDRPSGSFSRLESKNHYQEQQYPEFSRHADRYEFSQPRSETSNHHSLHLDRYPERQTLDPVYTDFQRKSYPSLPPDRHASFPDHERHSFFDHPSRRSTFLEHPSERHSSFLDCENAHSFSVPERLHPSFSALPHERSYSTFSSQPDRSHPSFMVATERAHSSFLSHERSSSSLGSFVERSYSSFPPVNHSGDSCGHSDRNFPISDSLSERSYRSCPLPPECSHSSFSVTSPERSHSFATLPERSSTLPERSSTLPERSQLFLNAPNSSSELHSDPALESHTDHGSERSPDPPFDSANELTHSSSDVAVEPLSDASTQRANSDSTESSQPRTRSGPPSSLLRPDSASQHTMGTLPLLSSLSAKKTLSGSPDSFKPRKFARHDSGPPLLVPPSLTPFPIAEPTVASVPDRIVPRLPTTASPSLSRSHWTSPKFRELPLEHELSKHELSAREELDVRYHKQVLVFAELQQQVLLLEIKETAIDRELSRIRGKTVLLSQSL